MHMYVNDDMMQNYVSYILGVVGNDAPVNWLRALWVMHSQRQREMTRLILLSRLYNSNYGAMQPGSY